MTSSSPLLPPESFHLMAAVGWLELENSPEARAELENISVAYREHPDVLEVWWKIFADEKDWSSALVVAEKLLAAAPDRLSGWVDRSYALHELKRTGEAYDRLSGVVEKFREHYVVPYNLACYQCCLGNHEAALRWLRCAIEASDAKTIRQMAAEDADLAPLREAIARLAQA